MKSTVRVFLMCAAPALYLAVLRITQPASPPGSPGATPLTIAIAVSFLILSFPVAKRLGRLWSFRRFVGAAVSYFIVAAVPLSYSIYGALTGWIRLIGRYGKLNDYSVIASPIGYWGTFAFYVVILTVVLSLAFSYLRAGDAP